jgi:hypothetical protein
MYAIHLKVIKLIEILGKIFKGKGKCCLGKVGRNPLEIKYCVIKLIKSRYKSDFYNT